MYLNASTGFVYLHKNTHSLTQQHNKMLFPIPIWFLMVFCKFFHINREKRLLQKELESTYYLYFVVFSMCGCRVLVILSHNSYKNEAKRKKFTIASILCFITINGV